MAFGHEKRNVYRAAIESVGWKSTGRITSTPIPMPTPTPKEYHDRQQDECKATQSMHGGAVGGGGGAPRRFLTARACARFLSRRLRR